ncbi:MAG TPA: hypothetical protein VK752_21355 [Bryobacteraceae bacterium]|jgi:hypothetical protein|nr:hypothetical protein [Bryobacteraceae bacterium]
MLWLLLAFFLMPYGEIVRLYLKDGTYQLTTEYKVVKDRVSYLSSERGEWEELPLEMVDLARTKKEAAQHEEDLKADAKIQAEEDKADRLAARQVEEIPQDPGVYYIHNEKLETIKVAESKVVNDKRRQVLKVLSPVPMVSGKATLEIDGDSAPKEIDEKRPEFFFRLSTLERLAMVKLTSTKKGSRIVENIQIVPVTKEIMQVFKEIQTFKKQEGDNVYKIWPEKDLDPGEYAIVEYTDGLESINTQVWDFKIK